MTAVDAHVWDGREWEVADVLAPGDGAWEPIPLLLPGQPGPAPDALNLHREDPRPYMFPTERPWNPPVPCQLPTYDGSGHTTHPDVVDFWREYGPGETHLGYRFWMAHTPYPGQNNRFENPSISVSNNGWDWHDPYGVINPVVPAPPAPYFNADCDMAWNPDLGRFDMIWKIQDPHVRYQHASSEDGITWTDPVALLGEHTLGGGVSPALIRTGLDQWQAIIRVRADLISGISVYTAPTPEGPWSGPTAGTITGDMPNVPTEHLWHLDAILADDGYWMLASTHPGAGSGGTEALIYPGRSPDGIDWTFGPAVLLNEPGSPDRYKYRPTLTMHEDGQHVRVWYSEMGSMRVWHTLIPRSEWPTI